MYERQRKMKMKFSSCFSDSSIPIPAKVLNLSFDIITHEATLKTNIVDKSPTCQSVELVLALALIGGRTLVRLARGNMFIVHTVSTAEGTSATGLERGDRNKQNITKQGGELAQW